MLAQGGLKRVAEEGPKWGVYHEHSYANGVSGPFMIEFISSPCRNSEARRLIFTVCKTIGVISKKLPEYSAPLNILLRSAAVLVVRPVFANSFSESTSSVTVWIIAPEVNIWGV